MIRAVRGFRLTACTGAVFLTASCGLGSTPAPVESTTGEDAIPGNSYEQLLAAVDSVVHEVLASDVVPGMAIGIMLGSDTLLLRGYGDADLSGRNPMTAAALLPIGSLVKQFTAAAILGLTEQDKLGLDDGVRKFFPEVPQEWQEITVHHLLNHTSGIPRSLAPNWTGRERDTRDDMLLELSERGPLEFRPGERWAYNNAGYTLLALLVERITGESYHNHIRRVFLEPLGMRATFDSDSVPRVQLQAIGYDTVQARVVERIPRGFAAALGSGFYHSTAGDMLVWQQALRHARVLRADTYERMVTPTVLNSGEPWPYGYGLWLRDLDGLPRVGHGGIQAGFRSYMGYLPEEDLSIVVLINSGAVDSWAVGESILHAVLRAQSMLRPAPTGERVQAPSG